MQYCTCTPQLCSRIFKHNDLYRLYFLWSLLQIELPIQIVCSQFPSVQSVSSRSSRSRGAVTPLCIAFSVIRIAVKLFVWLSVLRIFFNFLYFFLFFSLLHITKIVHVILSSSSDFYNYYKKISTEKKMCNQTH